MSNTPVPTFNDRLVKSLDEKGLTARFIELTNENTFKTELSFAMQHFNKNPSLKNSTLSSNLMAVLNIAHIGLTLNPVSKLAYLVPRWSPSGQETHLEVSYMGLCKLVTDTGSAKRIYSHVVYEGDEFKVSLGIKMDLTHTPKYKTKTVTHVYSVAILHDGSPMIEVMTKEEIDQIRERSESYKHYLKKQKEGKPFSCVWVTDYTEMARKTVIRRAIKQIPKTDQWDRVGQAVSLDESDYAATQGQVSLIEGLLMTCAIPEHEQNSLYHEMSSMSATRANEVISYLQDHQRDPIESADNYSVTDAKEKVEEKLNDPNA